MTDKTELNPFVKFVTAENENIENEIRSKLRYCWQRAITFAISYKPTIQEVIDELVESFLMFIPKSNTKRNEFRRITIESFHSILGKLYTSKDISDLAIEDEFIEIAIDNLQPLIGN